MSVFPTSPTLVILDTPTVAQVVQGARTVLEVETGLQGIPGPAGTIAAVTFYADQALSGHRVVRMTSDTTVNYADNTIDAEGPEVRGITNGAAAAGALATIVDRGDLTEPSWAWTPLLPVFLSTNGQLTQTPPGPGDGSAFCLEIGVATSATSVFVDVQTAIYY